MSWWKGSGLRNGYGKKHERKADGKHARRAELARRDAEEIDAAYLAQDPLDPDWQGHPEGWPGAARAWQSVADRDEG